MNFKKMGREEEPAPRKDVYIPENSGVQSRRGRIRNAAAVKTREVMRGIDSLCDEPYQNKITGISGQQIPLKKLENGDEDRDDEDDIQELNFDPE